LLITNSLSQASNASSKVSTLITSPRFADFGERNRQNMPICPIHDLEAPAATVLAYLITLRNEARGIIQRFFSRRKGTLADITFRVLDHTALRNDVEVVKSRLWPRQRHLVRIMEVAAGTRCASHFPTF